MDFHSPGVGHQCRSRFGRGQRQAQALGMVGHDQKIQRAADAGAHAAARHNLLAAGKTVGICGPQSGSDQPGIAGQHGVQVGVTPEHMTGRVLYKR